MSLETLTELYAASPASTSNTNDLFYIVRAGVSYAMPRSVLFAAGVGSVANSDGTLTVSPGNGDVVASLNLSHANTWLVTPQTFVCDTDAHVGVIVKGHSGSQSADLLQGKSSAGTVLFAIGPAGQVKTGNVAAASGPVGTVTGKLEIFTVGGVSLGFIPVYDAIT